MANASLLWFYGRRTTRIVMDTGKWVRIVLAWALGDYKINFLGASDMKKIILLIVLAAAQMHALQVGLSQQRITSPIQQLQAQYRNASVKSSEYTFEQEAGKPNIEYVPHGLLIFLNELDEACYVEAVSDYLVTALAQNIGPLLVSTSLLRSIFSVYQEKKSAIKAQTSNLYSRFFGKKLPVDANDPCRILATSNFDINKWIIKDVNKDLCLLIPYSYLEEIKINPDQLKYHENKEISPIELTLGLKVNHMATLQVNDILQRELIKQKNAAYFVQALYNGDLFCTRQDYLNSSVDQPLWTWFMVGHGLQQQTIAFIPIDEFKKILDYAATQVTLRLFMYLTCYGAGINTSMLYNDEKTKIQKTYPFAIVTQAIVDAPLLAWSYKDNETKKERINRNNDFKTFINLTRKKDMSYQEIVNLMFHIIPNKYFAGDIAQIKLPGIEWFSTIAGKKDVVNIGSVIAQTRTKPFDIQKFFKAAPKALLLESTYVPFEIIINAPDMEYILSTLPGDTYTYIFAISSQVHTISTILSWFQKIGLHLSLKIFYIQRIHALNGSGKLTEYTDVIAFPNGDIYFKQGDEIYSKKRDKDIVKENEPHFSYTDEYMQRVKNKAFDEAQKIGVIATEKTEGLSPEHISKLENLLKTRDV